MPVQATVILDSGCFLPYVENRSTTDIGYFQSARSVSDIRVVADGQELKIDELKSLGKSCVIEIRHVKASGGEHNKGATSSPTFHDELLHMKDLYGEDMEVDAKKFDCILRFNAGLFCGALSSRESLSCIGSSPTANTPIRRQTRRRRSTGLSLIISMFTSS